MLCNFCKPLPVHIIIILVYLSKCIFDFVSSCSVLVHDTQYFLKLQHFWRRGTVLNTSMARAVGNLEAFDPKRHNIPKYVQWVQFYTTFKTLVRSLSFCQR